MEALAAISLAGNIVQFIDTARSLVTTARQLRASGSTTEHRELALLARELRGLVERATRDAEAPTSGAPSAHWADEPLRLLVTQCEDVAKEVLSLLNHVDVGDDAGKLETALAVLRSNRKRDEIQALQGRLDRISHAVDLHLGFYDRRRVLARIDDLAAENRRLETHRAGEIRQLKSEFVECFERLSLDRRRAKTLLFDASGKALQLSAEQAVLDELHFSGIGQREASVHTAHWQTLTWVFGKPEQSSPASFEEWLSSDDDLYWISGKPGSGKSTLMKFLTHHPHTEAALESWARGHAVVRAEYFFWATSGAGLHKSQQGLLQSIVYRILRDRPELVTKVYREAFNGAKVLSRKGSLMPEISTSVPALLDALKAISSELSGSNARFCFFIDGLDEYDGKPLEVIELTGHLRSLPHVKVCVSSRPWNEFEQAFGGDGAKKLYMQDFNKVDISAYIDNTFTMDKNFQGLEPEDKTVQGAALIKEIAEAANGVFLWVYLVVRSFQEGLLNGDRLIDLRRRLVLLPTDLNLFYRRILTAHVHEFYREQSAVLFGVAEEAFSPLPLMAYWYIGEETAEKVDSQDYVWRLEARPLSTERIEKRLSDMRRRLTTCGV
ncbi:putative small s protein [Diaporthe ampelina]|uniref:Putative small s protein n=1 Tax=Diaporthe ampelina TaxID=1214573 RepID=A0A0G2FIW0_9PEZI|nr:putative small s protein [Diaporthe ampelina]